MDCFVGWIGLIILILNVMITFFLHLVSVLN